MIKDFKSYFILITLVSAACGGAIYSMIADQMLVQLGLILVGAYYLIGTAVAALLFNYMKKRPGLFIRAYMGSSTVKFLLLLGLLIGLAFSFRDHLVFITIVFFALYVLYTVFEKAFIFRAYKAQNDAGQDTNQQR